MNTLTTRVIRVQSVWLNGWTSPLIALGTAQYCTLPPHLAEQFLKDLRVAGCAFTALHMLGLHDPQLYAGRLLGHLLPLSFTLT